MSLRDTSPPRLVEASMAAAVRATSYDARRLIVQQVREKEKLRAAQWKAASDATLNPTSSVPISAAPKPKVKRAC